MKLFYVLLLVCFACVSTGCSSAESRAHKANANVQKERLKLIEDYKKCIKKAGEDQEKAAGCDHYLKAAEALK